MDDDDDGFFAGFDGLVDVADDFRDAVHVGLGVRHQNAVDPLEEMNLSVGVLQELDGLLGFRQVDVLQRNHLAHHRVGLFTVLGRLRLGWQNGHGFLAGLGVGHHLEELVAHFEQRNAVHAQHTFDGLQVFVEGEGIRLTTQRDRGLGETGRHQDGALCLLGIVIEHDFDRGAAEIETVAAGCDRFTFQVLRFKGRRGGARGQCRAGTGRRWWRLPDGGRAKGKEAENQQSR